MVTIESQKILDQLLHVYEGEDQIDLEVEYEDYILFLDCRFIFNEYLDQNIGKKVNRLMNAYVYDYTLNSKVGFKLEENEWDLDQPTDVIDRNIYELIKSTYG